MRQYIAKKATLTQEANDRYPAKQELYLNDKSNPIHRTDQSPRLAIVGKVEPKKQAKIAPTFRIRQIFSSCDSC